MSKWTERELLEKEIDSMRGYIDIREAADKSGYPTLMLTGVKTAFYAAYKQVPSLYEQFCAMESSDKYQEIYGSIGSAPMPEKIVNHEYPRQSGHEDKVIITNMKYGAIFGIDLDALEDEQVKGQLKSIPAGYGESSKKKRNKGVFSFIAAGTSTAIYDANYMFDESHPNYTGGAANSLNKNVLTAVTLSATSLKTALGQIRQWRDKNGEPVMINPKVLCVPTDLELTAYTLMRNTWYPTAAYYTENVFKGLMDVMVCPWLTTTGARYYIFTDCKGMVFQNRVDTQLLTRSINEGSGWDRDEVEFKVRYRAGLGVQDWRFGMAID